MGNILSNAVEIAEISFTTVVRWIFVLLVVFILIRQIRSLLRSRNPSEIWAYLACPDESNVPLTHWENLIGRGRGCDIILNLSNVSRSHATLIRDSAGTWRYNDLNSKNGSFINGRKVTEPTVIKSGDTITVGGADFHLYPVSYKERMENIERRKHKSRPISPWPSLVALTLLQVLAVIQLSIALQDDFIPQIPISFGALCALMWAYVAVMRFLKRTGFEMEIITFFLSTLSLAVTASKYPGEIVTQCVSIFLGVGLFVALCWYFRDLIRTKKVTYLLLGLSVALLLFNLIFGTVINGAKNWIYIGDLAVQPSEFVKIVLIYVGAATLDELQQRRNLTVFMLFSVFCLGSLAIMHDFGTAMIFFVTFLIISFLRSGDFSKLILITGAAGLMGLMVLRFKSHVMSRFEIWGNVWEDPFDKGFQQVQSMTSIASGGLLGLGAGEGNLTDVDAAETDLVFGVVGEEWGLIIAVLAVLCIFTLGIFAIRSIIAGRSTYYSIAACAATSLYIFQTILNVFGSLDLLPLTGVVFPFLSSGGSSMITSWGLLAFLKTADTRQNASFAVRLDRDREFENEIYADSNRNPEEFLAEEDMYARENDGYGSPRSQHKKPPASYSIDSNRETQVHGLYLDDEDIKKAGKTVPKPSGVQEKAYKNKQRNKYRDLSDEDFFDSFGDGPEKDRSESRGKDSPLTLDDIFGDRKK